jgi:PAS domain S-box-containing protein
LIEVDCLRVLDALADGVVAADAGNRIVYLNPAAEQLLGWSAMDLIGLPLTTIIPPRLRAAHLAGFRRYLFSGEQKLFGHAVRLPALRHDGGEVEIELTLNVSPSSTEGPLFIASLRDLAERIELERQISVTRYLRAATRVAAQLDSLLDLGAVLHSVVETLAGDFDAALARIWLYEPAEDRLYLRASAGLSPATSTSSRARIDVREETFKVGEVARTREPFVTNELAGDPQFDQEWVRREGIAAVAAFPLLAGGDLLGVLVYFSRQPLRDEIVEVLTAFVAMVTASINDVRLFEEKEQLVRQVESQRQRYRFLAEASTLLTSSLDYQTTLEQVARLVVPSLCDWCSIDLVEADGEARQLAIAHVDRRKEALARELRQRFPPTCDDWRGLAGVLRTGQPAIHAEIKDADLVRAAPDEEHARALRELGVRSCMCVPLVAQGRTLGAITLVAGDSGRRYGPDELALVEDLARRAAVSIENARLYRELQRGDRAKDQFIATLAHELRNPLGPIFNAVELVKLARPADPRIRRAQETIERQVRHQARLLDDLLNVTRIARAKILLRRQPVDLTRLVRDTAEDHTAAMEKAGLKLIAELPVAPVWVDGDPARLAQVLDNLLQNAAKFTDRGGQVNVRLAALPDSYRASLTVRDTGLGIEPELLSHLFESFAQADRSLDRSRGGLGLGLALVKGLVELHGGVVRAHSDGPGRGAQFTILLPMAEAPAAREGPSPPTGAQNQFLRILLIEDHRDAVTTLRDLLELSGHEVETAYNGPDGLAIAAGFRPDVVLCDLGLPGMDGFEVANALRRDPATSSARLIAITGYGQEEDQRRSREAGFDEHLVKPVDFKELTRLLGSDSLVRQQAEPDRPDE